VERCSDRQTTYDEASLRRPILCCGNGRPRWLGVVPSRRLAPHPSELCRAKRMLLHPDPAPRVIERDQAELILDWDPIRANGDKLPRLRQAVRLLSAAHVVLRDRQG